MKDEYTISRVATAIMIVLIVIILVQAGVITWYSSRLRLVEDYLFNSIYRIEGGIFK